MDTYYVELYDSNGKLLEDQSKAISGFSFTACKTQGRLARADAMTLQDKETLKKKYYVAEYSNGEFLRWVETTPQKLLERIGQA